MGICLTGAVEGLCRLGSWVIKVVGQRIQGCWGAKLYVASRDFGVSYHFPITLTRADKLRSGLLDGVLMAVSVCWDADSG